MYYCYLTVWLRQFYTLWQSKIQPCHISKDPQYSRMGSTVATLACDSLLPNLHWLPISHRIKFKPATLTFKILTFIQPSYHREHLIAHVLSCTLRSSGSNLLVILHMRTVNGSHAFRVSVPTVWKSLPHHIRSCQSLTQLQSHLPNTA